MELLQMQEISKIFGTIVVNRDICLSCRQGEIHALMGENGAGKSTLMNILYGLLKPDAGEIRLDGEVVRFSNPLDALKAGIAMVHQTFRQFPNLTVWENMIFPVFRGLVCVFSLSFSGSGGRHLALIFSLRYSSSR